MSKQKPESRLVGITIGDINGVGPEVVMKTFLDNRIIQSMTPVIYASQKVIAFYRKTLKLDKFNYYQAKSLEDINPKKVNVLSCWEESVELKPGSPTDIGGKYAALSLTKAAEDLKSGKLKAVVTAPINKKSIQSDSFNYPGHTEFFADYFEAKDNLMMLVSEELRVGVATGHIPLKQVADKITKDRILRKIKVMEKSLKNDFDIVKPKIAVLGLNPHAGDDGLLGNEEERVISPVIEELKSKGKLIFGPFPADGFFGSFSFQKYDGIMAMYHDQGLIPFKTISFQEGINYTAGLPVVRTSPDHGTAFDLAGKGVADEGSMRRAVLLAGDILKIRSERENTTAPADS